MGSSIYKEETQNSAQPKIKRPEGNTASKSYSLKVSTDLVQWGGVGGEGGGLEECKNYFCANIFLDQSSTKTFYRFPMHSLYNLWCK